MIEILIVDDSPEKVIHLQSLLSSFPELDQNKVLVVQDLVSARDTLAKRYFDLLILDICIPFATGELASAEAGRQFVRELAVTHSLIKPAHIIGLTAYDDALLSADSAFVDEVWRLIKYDASKDDWERQLRSKIGYLLRSKHELMTGVNAGFDFDLAIITALQRPELKAVLDLPVSWRSSRFSNDATEYHTGVPNDGSKQLKIVAASATQMGIAAAAVLGMKIIGHFRPRYLAMVGIAAGIKDAGVELGYILIADQSWDYESGKRKVKGVKGSELIPDPHFIPLKSDLKERFLSCVGRGAYVREIEDAWRGPQPKTRLRAILGPVATGAAVVEDPNVARHILQHSRKAIGLEMETYGAFFSGENCTKPRPEVFSIKSVCDFADAEKDDDFQEYAAFTSAQYFWHFAHEHLAR